MNSFTIQRTGFLLNIEIVYDNQFTQVYQQGESFILLKCLPVYSQSVFVRKGGVGGILNESDPSTILIKWENTNQNALTKMWIILLTNLYNIPSILSINFN